MVETNSSSYSQQSSVAVVDFTKSSFYYVSSIGVIYYLLLACVSADVQFFGGS
jgi:hypothetical protein